MSNICDATLAIIDEFGELGEPVTTPADASALGFHRCTVYERLHQLEERSDRIQVGWRRSQSLVAAIGPGKREITGPNETEFESKRSEVVGKTPYTESEISEDHIATNAIEVLNRIVDAFFVLDTEW